MRRIAALLLAAVAGACAGAPSSPALTFTASGLGAEADVVRAQLARFAARHPGVAVELRVTPDAADQRHQLYVQWLNARAQDPDVLQLDIIWTAEFAGAGWIRALDQYSPDAADFFPAAIASNRWRGALYALPWFVDVGLLYWRTDLISAPPQSLDALRDAALRSIAEGETRWGLAWQGARYEGLVTVFVEHLGAFGGGILDPAGEVIVAEPAAVRALTFMRDSIDNGLVPASSLTWQEEQVRFAFQNGQTAFMRNWPYAWALLRDPAQSRVAGRVGVAPFPGAAGGRATAALGGAQLAVNAFSDQPELAWELVEFLTAPEQMLERARMAAQLPSRQSLYDSPELARALDMPLHDVRAAVAAAVPRPVTPVYSELSELLQVHLHRALTGQQSPQDALDGAAADIRQLLARSGLAGETVH
jgi:ABC-type glycerol-3-phosphate transport system substrate-binding protein